MAPAVIQQTPKSDEENFPYKATQMWYQTIEDFRRGMPRRTHWFLLKQYEETFTGNEAVTWMRAHLASRPEFTGTVGGVRKEQAIGLLRKFLKAGVFERVRSSASAGPFKDNSEIYRMTNQSPATVIRTPGRPPLASRENQTAPSSLMKPRQLVEEMVAKTNRLFSQDKENQEERNEVVATEEIKECHLVLRPLTAFQREELWRRALLVRLQFTLCHGESLPPISGAWVAHNCTKLSPKGTTLPLPRASPEPLLPSWVLQAMKCLAHWPNPEYGTELPSYAGFVTDVFHVVSDYFYQQPEPLIALDLYPCVRNAFERAEVIDSKWRLHRRGWQGGEYVDSEKLRRWGTDSISSDSRRHLRQQSSSAVLDSLDEQLMKWHLSQGWHKTSTPEGIHGVQVNKRTSPPHQLSSILPPNSCLEAAFTSDHPPHYRVIPRSSVDSLHLSSSGSSLPLQAAEGEHSTPTTAGEKSAALRGKETSRAPHQRHVSEPAPSSNPEGVGCALSSNPTGNQVSEVSPVKIWTKRERRGSGDYTVIAYSSSSSSGMHTSSDVSATIHASSTREADRQRNYAFVKHRAPSRPASTMKRGHSPPPMRQQNGIHARTRSASGDLLSQKSRRLGGLVPFSRSSLVNRGQSTSSFKPSVVVAAKNSYSGGHYSPITPSRGNYISYCPLGNDLNAVGSKGGYVNLALDPGDTPPPSSEIKEFFRGMNMNSTRESSGIGSIEDGLAPSTPGSLSPRCSDTLGGGPVPIQPMRRPPPPPFIPPPDPITKPALMAFPDESQIENHKATPAVAVLEERRPSAPNYELMRSDGLLTPEGNAQALQSLRLLLLMLHPDQRRRLQLLIRMMARMVNNKELVLPGTGSKEDLLLTTFSGGILRSQTENVRAHDSDIATKVVRFLVKNHEELFRPPPDLVQEVQKKIEDGQQSTRVTYESLDSQQMTFCQKITREEYERQRMTGSQMALYDLLGQILEDETIGEKMRAKKLKKFKKQYPEIYAQKFPDSQLPRSKRHSFAPKFNFKI